MTFSKPQLVLFIIVSLSSSFWAGNAGAAEHRVSNRVSDVNCLNFGGGVRPGDQLIIDSGVRDTIKFLNCKGTANQPIEIRNDTSGAGPAVIRRDSANSGGFIFTCTDCEHVRINGSDGWRGTEGFPQCGSADGNGACGIKITSSVSGDAPAAFMAIRGSSKNIVVQGVEIDGRWPSLTRNGIGISVNDMNYNRSDHPGEWRENITLRDNYVHHVEGECLYAGPNWEFQGAADDLRLRNIEIANNLITDCGWDGINLKSAIEGINRIHHNVIKRAGSAKDSSAGQHSGIAFYESGNGYIHHNWVEDSGESGIQHYLHRMPSSQGVMTSEIFNNVIVNSGVTGPLSGKGITVSRAPDASRPKTKIYNNTVVTTVGEGINVDSTASSESSVFNNIVANAGKSAIAIPDGISAAGNRTGSIDSMKFMNAFRNNFRLQETSALVNSGDERAFADDDFDGVVRPQGGKPDIGAFEYSTSDPSVRPNPPELVAQP